MKGDRYPGKFLIKSTQGFTLIELMIVVVIIGILATGVVFMFSNPSARSKNQAFTMLGEFNMARSEAVSQNADAIITFLPGATDDVQDGYRIWIDDWVVGGPPPNTGSDGLYTLDVPATAGKDGDTLIRETFFPQKVQYYDPTAVPSGGPDKTPGLVGNLIGGSGIVLEDSSTIASFAFESDGTLEDAITEAISVVVFVPKESHEEIYGAPYATTISPSTGRIRISRWTEAGSWKTK